MSRMFLPSVRETYTDQHSLIEQADVSRRLLEEYRALYTAVLARIGQDRGVIIGVCSPTVRDGKTTVATNIAVAMAADLERRVLLAACTLQGAERPGQGQKAAHPGLSEYVGDPDQSLDDLLVRTPMMNLWVLFAGARPDNPSRLVRCERMRQALAEFRERFDITVLDLPPVLAASDAQVLASLADGVLLVVGLEHSTVDGVQRAVQALGGTPLLGIAANRLQPQLPRWLSKIVGSGEWAV